MQVRKVGGPRCRMSSSPQASKPRTCWRRMSGNPPRCGPPDLRRHATSCSSVRTTWSHKHSRAAVFILAVHGVQMVPKRLPLAVAWANDLPLRGEDALGCSRKFGLLRAVLHCLLSKRRKINHRHQHKKHNASTSTDYAHAVEAKASRVLLRTLFIRAWAPLPASSFSGRPCPGDDEAGLIFLHVSSVGSVGSASRRPAGSAGSAGSAEAPHPAGPQAPQRLRTPQARRPRRGSAPRRLPQAPRPYTS